MNTTTRTALRLLIATPLAASALVVGGFAGIAQAETPGFEPNPGLIIAVPSDDEDPKPQGPGEIAIPKDDQDPKPQGPGDLTNPKDDDDPKPQGPGDITNPEDNDDPKPEGPGDITNPEDNDDPKPEGPDDLTNPEPGDKPEDKPADNPGGKSGKDVEVADSNDTDQVDGDVVTADVQVPSRIDAGAGSADEGTDLAWVLAGGGVMTAAAGSLLLRRRMTSNR